MKPTQMFSLVLMISIPALFTSACVGTGTHEAVLKELAGTQQQLKALQVESEQQQQQADATQQKLEGAKNDLGNKLDLAMGRNATLVSQLKDLGKNVEQLSDERSQLTEERSRLEKELEQLRRMRAAAEKRNAQYSKLLSKLRSMIDAGTLTVKIRGGRMMVQLSNDVLFPPGGTRLKPEGQAAIVELAQTIQEFSDRKFQVMGHSDPTPINTPRYPSNWELSSQRAIEVAKLLIENGVPPAMISAAGQAEFDPLVTEPETEEQQAMNRRVEILFVPTIDEMPDFSQTDDGDKPAEPSQQPATGS